MKLVSDKPSDPVAIHELEQMKMTLEQSMQQLEMIQQQNEELKMQNAQLSLAVNNMKETNMMKYAEHQDKMALDQAKLNLEAEKAGVQMNLDIIDKQANIAKQVVETEQKKLDLAQDAMRGV